MGSWPSPDVSLGFQLRRQDNVQAQLASVNPIRFRYGRVPGAYGMRDLSLLEANGQSLGELL